MKTVKYKGLTITGPDLEVDKILYDLDNKETSTEEITDLTFEKVCEDIKAFNKKVCGSNYLGRDEAGWIKYNTQWTKQFILCMQAELIELLDNLPWKHWKDYSDFELKREEIRFEIADLFIFLIGIAQIWNLPGFEILEDINKKMAVNEARQNNGY